MEKPKLSASDLFNLYRFLLQLQEYVFLNVIA